jgi:hypothetical protein
MKRNTHILTLTLAISVFSHIAVAEVRTWVDNNGHKLDAELIGNLHGQVSLRTKENKVVHVSISSLCADDQKFVLRNTPPEIDIDVVEITDRHNEGFG